MSADEEEERLKIYLKISSSSSALAGKPVILYGRESWSSRKKNLGRRSEIKFLRKVKGYTELDRLRKVITRGELEVNTIVDDGMGDNRHK